MVSFLNISNIKKSVEKRFFHRMDVYSYFEDDEGISKKELIYENQPCFIFNQTSSFFQDQNFNKNNYFSKLFFSNDIFIQAGSFISVYILGFKRNFVVSSEPTIYSTHSEIVLKRDDFF